MAPAKCTGLADQISRAVEGFELMQTRSRQVDKAVDKSRASRSRIRD